MNQHPYILTIFRGWPLLIVATIIGGAAGWGLSQLATPLYQSNASLYFSIGVGTTATDFNQGATFTQAQMLSFAQLAESTAVLQPVIQDLGLDATPSELASAINVSTPEKTVVLNIVVTDADSANGAKIANAVAAQLSTVATETAPRTPDGRASVTVRTIDPATSGGSASSPNTRVNVIAGLLIGLLLAIIFLLVRSMFDNRVRTEEMVGELTPAPVLGIIDREKVAHHGAPEPQLALLRDPVSATAESYRVLRSNLLHAVGRPVTMSLVVTSAIEREGKSTVAANLAMAFAESGARVVLVDADLRHPSVAGLAKLAEEPGLSSLIAGSGTVSSVVTSAALGGADVLTAGPRSLNPGESIASDGLSTLMTQLRKHYDVIILDSPALDGIADAAVLAHSVDGVLLVADRRRLRAPELARALESLEKSGANVLGVVLNHTPVHLPGSAQGSSTTTEASVPLLSVTSKSSELPFGTLNT